MLALHISFSLRMKVNVGECFGLLSCGAVETACWTLLWEEFLAATSRLLAVCMGADSGFEMKPAVWLTCACAGCLAGFPAGDGWERALTMAAWSEYLLESWCPPRPMKSWESSAVPRPSRSLLPQLGGWASLLSQERTPVSPFLHPRGSREGGRCRNKASVNRRAPSEARLGAEEQPQAYEFFLSLFLCLQLALWWWMLPLSVSPFDSWERITSVLGAWRYRIGEETAAEFKGADAAQLPGPLCSHRVDRLLRRAVQILMWVLRPAFWRSLSPEGATGTSASCPSH